MADEKSPGDSTVDEPQLRIGAPGAQEAETDWTKVATPEMSLKALLQIFQDTSLAAPQVRPDPGKQELDATGIDTGASLAGVSDLEVADANGEIDVTPYNRILLQAAAVTEDQVVVVEARHSTSGAWETISPELGGLVPAGEDRYLLGVQGSGADVSAFDRVHIRAKYDSSDGGTLDIFGQLWSGDGPIAPVVRYGTASLTADENKDVAHIVVPPSATEIHVTGGPNDKDFRFRFLESDFFNVPYGINNGPSNIANSVGVYSDGIPTPFVRVTLEDKTGSANDHRWQIRVPSGGS